MTYLIHTWCHPALVVRKSKINGQGIFTTKPIPAGEKVLIFGGEAVDKSETDKPNYREMSFFPISDDQFLASTTEEKDEYLNHSCEPNIWLVDEVTTTAIRDINPGEEITLDCATWDCDQEWIYSETGQCSCGSSQCRKTLSPDDWRKPAIQQKYQGHFAPYIQKKINRQHSTRLSKLILNVVRAFVDEKENYGNPVGIVVDEKRRLDDKKRQEIAAKLNYSETVFVNDLEKPNVSIFNPTSEVKFAGHALLGTAYFLKHQLELKFASIKCGGQEIKVTEKGKLTFIEAPLSIMPPWQLKQLPTAKTIETLDKNSFVNKKPVMVWAWIDQDKNLIRARTFAPSWGIPEDQANGSGSMLLAAKLGKNIKVIHGRGSEIFASPVDKKIAKVGGLVRFAKIP